LTVIFPRSWAEASEGVAKKANARRSRSRRIGGFLMCRF
jgi:hypothetical protein